jgi:hypothetical protein
MYNSHFPCVYCDILINSSVLACLDMARIFSELRTIVTTYFSSTDPMDFRQGIPSLANWFRGVQGFQDAGSGSFIR